MVRALSAMAEPPSTSAGGIKQESGPRLLISAISTLTLSILGRSAACPLLLHASPHLLHVAAWTPGPPKQQHAEPKATHACLPRSSVLPVPFAFSRMGVLLGILTMAVVAYSNSLTSVLLLRAAGLTGHDTYEGVAHAVAGPVWKARSPHAAPQHGACRAYYSLACCRTILLLQGCSHCCLQTAATASAVAMQTLPCRPKGCAGGHRLHA